MMPVPPAPGVNDSLQARVDSQLDRWIKPCYTKPFEYIGANANDRGEVWLSGLVKDPQLVAEAIRVLREVPGVKCVFDHVTVMHAGRSITMP